MAPTDPKQEAEEPVVEATEVPETDAPEQPETEAAAPAKAKPKAAKVPKADKAETAAKPKADAKKKPAAEERQLVHAHAKYVRSSARKARLVCDHIRGKSVTEARAILALTPRAVAEDWEKLLNSAVANAEHNHDLVGEDLRIASITADEGPTLKRFRPRAMGRASKIRKRTSHLSITLSPKE
ncbi:unannotated protein [freshwater metagenome]|uniref:Unannotated protein n=1 Tax=freshwater metagenome TaxID=449393 RepID=A0A6J7IDG2_9ZZZZ